MHTNEVQNILSTIKTMLKNRSIHYREFADMMDMSESGIKKLLNGSDCSLSRMIQMAQVLSVPLHEIINASEGTEPHTIQLTDAQQNFFVENMGYFYFFSTFVERLYSREQLSEVTGLSEGSIDGYIRKLADLGLLPLIDDGTLHVCPNFIRSARSSAGVALFVGPRINRLIREQMCGDLLAAAEEFACNGSEVYDSDTLSRISEAFLQRRFTLTVASIDALRLSLRELINTFAQRSAIDSTTHSPDELVSIGWSYVLAPFDGGYKVPEL